MLRTVRQKVAVVGATGQVGRHVAADLGRDGYEAVAISRSAGVDVVTGAGLDEALAGVDAVVDVLNTTDQENAVAFFGATTRNLLDAEQRTGVRHHVLLSIVGIDRVEGNPHYAGKREQERLVEDGPVPWTILRATQFFGFAAMVAERTVRDGVAAVPPLLMQPVDVADVADVLVRTAVGTPQGRPGTWPARRRWTSSTWPAARWPRAVTRRGCERAGGTARSASRWPARCSCPDRTPGSAARRSTPGWPGNDPRRPSRLAFALHDFPHRPGGNPSDDLDLASFGVVATLDRSGTTYPGLPWEPKAAFTALAEIYG